MQPGHSSVLQESFSLGFGFRLQLVGPWLGDTILFPGLGFGKVRVEGLVWDILLFFVWKLCMRTKGKNLSYLFTRYHRSPYRVGVYYPQGPRTQVIGLWGPNTNNIIVPRPYNPIIWVLRPYIVVVSIFLAIMHICNPIIWVLGPLGLGIG